MSEHLKTRPLFIYGTLRALPLLAWALTGDASNTAAVASLARPGKVYGYARFLVRGCDYPGVIQGDRCSSVDGLLLTFETSSQRKKLDDFEGETYRVAPVSVTLDTGETVEADMYVWAGERGQLSTEPWELASFVNERLQDWLDLFEGMVLVGED
ncbi:hypothetical protein QBC33DRAFT_203470 [Phialemonium atrogriseum]|uniref:Putative gamma-glutamylcyclotransferase n=1 Tax=Phialemonium atrogriseum TaxID=1093897 RepID=A0AAJ0FJE7_9PEZI|nr:uncharacterized protein QBC33DRAFT_203470 [Phialemonium atrogriseum]KAK1764339.1 hypothetical protein QBC33DRAFT_203470 [Phialemonium atrogriseum]